ncbi:MAG: mechanosensitive ion channel domain-containing protein [Bacilli bacterium]
MTDDRQKTPWRTLTASTLLLVVLAVIFNIAQSSTLIASIVPHDRLWADWAFALSWLVVGFWLVHHTTHLFAQFTGGQKTADARAWTTLRRVLAGVGYLFVAVVTLHLLHVQISSILVGGALTGVILGIAAQSTLSNLFAGLILLTVRPFSLGQTISIRSSYFSSVDYTGQVIDVNWYYTTIEDGERRRIVPNSAIITAVITIHSARETQVWSVSLPYHIAADDLRKAVSDQYSGAVSGSITDFGADAYTFTLEAPASLDPDIIRRAIASQRSGPS